MKKRIIVGLFVVGILPIYGGTQELKQIVKEQVQGEQQFSDEDVLKSFADDLTRSAARYEKGKTRGVPVSMLYDAAYTFTVAYDLKDKSWLTVFLRTNPKIEKSTLFVGGAAAMYASLWFKKKMHL